MPVAVPHPATSDADLAQRARRGDATAFTALYARHRAPLERFVAGRARDPEVAAEVVQLTFTRAWAALRAGAAPERPRAWLYAIARNATVDELRARDRARPAGDPETVGAGPAVRTEDDPEAALRQKELTELLWAAAESLPAADRELLELHVRRGLDVEALAARLHVRAGTMHTRLCRLRAALREAIVCELVMRRGGRACPVVAALLAGGDPAPLLRGAVRRHVRDCEGCRAFAHPSAILAGLLPLPAVARACERAARRFAVACALVLAASLLAAGTLEPADTAPAGFAGTRAIEPVARAAGRAPARTRGRRVPGARRGPDAPGGRRGPEEHARPRARAAAKSQARRAAERQARRAAERQARRAARPPAPTRAAERQARRAARPPAPTRAAGRPSRGTHTSGSRAARPTARVREPSDEVRTRARVLDGAERELPLPAAQTAPSAEPSPAPAAEEPAAAAPPKSPQPPPDPGEHP